MKPSQLRKQTKKLGIALSNPEFMDKLQGVVTSLSRIEDVHQFMVTVKWHMNDLQSKVDRQAVIINEKESRLQELREIERKYNIANRDILSRMEEIEWLRETCVKAYKLGYREGQRKMAKHP